MDLSVIIVAAGSGKRMGFDKLLAVLAGKPVLQHSIEAFEQHPDVGEVIVVCPEDRFNKLNIKATSKPIIQVNGGSERHLSVAKGIEKVALPSRYIAVHDGARPLISQEQITAIYQAAVTTGAAASARPATETMKQADSQGVVQADVNRDQVWIMETPQIFNAEMLKDAYNEVTKQDCLVTDEVSAMQIIKAPVQLVQNSSANPKITYPSDLLIVEALLQNSVS